MIFSYEWLSEYLEKIPKPEELLERLTMNSVEVEEVIEGGAEIGNVVVGELLKKKKHPNADTLNIGIFNVGEDASRQIIFSAMAELQVGDKLAIALAPTVLPGRVKIEERNLRGELSQGMCCLNSELGILNREDEVHLFNEEDVLNGTHIAGVLPIHETLIDIDNKSMTHRSDLFCHNNMAREIGAVFGIQYIPPKLKLVPEVSKKVQVTVEDTESCPRYIGIEMEVKVGQSPDEISKRLRACGVKSINNVVDITNYVMLELGEPTHAFDAGKLDGDGVVVRRGKKGEKLLALDNYSKELDDSILVIADAKKPIAIAGVIGGKDSSVTEKTTRIILEVANFEPLITRKAAQKVGSRTDGAMRWEKGLPPELATSAAQRAVELLQKYASGRVLAMTDHYPKKQKIHNIELTASHLQRITGVQFENNEVKELLNRLECQVEVAGKNEESIYRVTPPWFRVDLKIPEDIVEEVVRLHGVNDIPEQMLTGVLHVPEQEEDIEVVAQINKTLTSLGLYEVQNYSFYGEELMQKVGLNPEKEHIELQNPLSDDLRYLRANLLPRLLENVQLNLQQSKEFGLFEVGHLFFADREVKQLGIIFATERNAYRVIRGIAEQLLNSLHIPWTSQVIHKTLECQFWRMYKNGQALRIDVGENAIGTIGEVNAEVLTALNIKTAVGFCTFSVQQLLKQRHEMFTMKPFSQFPSIPLDLSLIVKEKIQWSTVEEEVRTQAGDLLQSIEVFDEYSGKGIPKGKKSIAFHMILQAKDRTLEMAEIEKWRDKLVGSLNKKVGAILRGK